MTLSEFLDSMLSNILLTVSQSPLLQWLLGIWLLLALFNQDHRNKLVENIAFFLRMPLSYDDKEEDAHESNKTNLTHETKNMPLYPRRWFEDGYKGLKARLVNPIKTIDGFLARGIKNIGDDHTFDSILGGIFLIIFIYADAIGGLNIISLVPGLISWTIPPWLSEYSITVIAGTILSVIVAAWISGSIYEKESTSLNIEEKTSENENQGLKNKTRKENPTRKIIARVLLVSSFVTIIGINLIKLPVFIPGLFAPDMEVYIKIVSNFFLHVVVMFNASLATFLLDAAGRKGLNLLVLLVLFPLYLLFSFLGYLFDLLTSLGPISLDILIRAIFVMLNIIAFYVIAPIDLGGDIFFKRSMLRLK
jgi:hypothetical protein